MKPTLYLIDGSSQMYRAFHAPIRTAEGGLLRNAQGRPTNAVYIFVTMLRKLLNEQRPEFIAASFDLPGRTFRDDLAADYKAHRAPMPDELAEQIPMVHAACEALGVPILTSERFEADDVIGTLTAQAAAAGFDVSIVTSDKDFYQLVGNGIKVFNPRDDGVWYDAEGVKEKFGVAPEHVVDVLALMGDTIDNIKGVPGIGEKGARELIATYGSLDNLLAHAGEVPQKRYREPLLAHAESARQSRELARIRTDVPVTFDPEALTYRGASRARCFEIFSELGFRTLVAEFAPTAATITKAYRTVSNADGLTALAGRIAAAGRVALRVLADGGSPMTASIVGISLATATRDADYVPIGHHALGEIGCLPLEAVLEALGPALANPAIQKVGHDLKSDAVLLARHGVSLTGLHTDTMLASYLVDATRTEHRLEDLSVEYLGYKPLSEEEVCGRGAKAVSLADVPVEAAVDYACERADLAGQLEPLFRDLLTREQLDEVYQTLELPLIPVLVDIERAGVRIDVPALAAQSQKVDQELARRSGEIFQFAGGEFNINSPKQLAEILFDKLQLPVLKRTGTSRAPSTAVEVLEELALAHDMPRLILEWRALMKLKGTYIDALPQLVNPQTGRVHTSFNQAVAATGRLSSSDPNLQNIPIRTELGREIRSAFVAEPGHTLISADYSQIELRVLAHLAEDETLIAAFQRGDDIHDQTALKVFGPDSTMDKRALRSTAKMINYALLYGKTAFTLSKDIGVTPQAAQAFIDAYFSGFPRVREFIDRTLEEARATGSVKTLFGRRRLVPDLTSRDFQRRSAAERVAVNLPIQGTAADIMKRAMLLVHAALAAEPDARMILTVHDELLFEVPKARASALGEVVRQRMESAAERVAVNLPIQGTAADIMKRAMLLVHAALAAEPDARMILTVHDELLFEVPKARALALGEVVRHRMESAAQLKVPLTVDVGIGDNWRDAKH